MRCKSCMEHVRQKTTCKRCLKTFPLEEFRIGIHGKPVTYCIRCSEIHIASQRKLSATMRTENQRMIAAGERKCLRCRAVKPLAEFTNENGLLKNRCLVCRDYMRKHRESVCKMWTPGRRALEAEQRTAQRKALRATVLAAYGNRCNCCGEATPEFLAIDHIEGDGAKHRRSLRGKERPYGVKASGFYTWLRDSGYPDKFQCLCHNCNVAKGLYGACPHTRADRLNKTP